MWEKIQTDKRAHDILRKIARPLLHHGKILEVGKGGRRSKGKMSLVLSSLMSSLMTEINRAICMETSGKKL